MSDTDIKNEDPIVHDQDDGGDDEVRDGFFPSPRYALGHQNYGQSIARSSRKGKPLMKKSEYRKKYQR